MKKSKNSTNKLNKLTLRSLALAVIALLIAPSLINYFVQEKKPSELQLQDK